MKFAKWCAAALTFITLGVICAVCAGAYNGIIASDGYYEYILEDDGTATITKYIGDDVKADVPAKIGGRNVGKIKNIFNGNSKIVTVTIADGITEMGDYVFSTCDNLTSVKLPSTITTIPKSAFAYCPKLTKVTVPDSVTRIEEKAFYCCDALSTVSLPKKLDYLGKQAFYACKSLKSVTVPDGVKTIEDQTFANSMYLQKVTLPATVTSIGSGAFLQCLSLSSVNLPANLTKILDNAFYYCDLLDNITIPSKVVSIGDSAFANCASLSRINIPASLTLLYENAFYRCGNIASVTVASGNTAFCSENGALYTKDMDKLILYPAKKAGTSFKVSDKTYYIRPYAFYKAEKLTSVTLPAKLYSVDDYAFYGCTALRSVTVPASVKLIGDRAFGFYYKINVTADQKVDGFVLRGTKNSAAQEYASENGFKFEVVSTAPTAVRGVTAGKVTDTSITLTWGINTSSDGYIIEIYKDGKWSRVTKITGNSTITYKVSGLKAGTAYKFRVKAYKMSGSTALYSDYSATVAARTNPSVIKGAKLTGRAADALRVNWTKNASADGYIVEMYQGNKWVRVGKITNNSTTTFRKAGLKASTVYKFRVRAYKMSGKTALYSNYSATVTARTNPSIMKGVKIAGKARDALRVNWTKNTSAQGYIVEMYKGGKWVRVAKITNNSTTTFRKAGLVKNTTYKFRVRAYHMSGKTALYGNYGSVSGRTAAK